VLKQLLIALCFVLGLTVFGTQSAHAYIDPGSGSAMISIVIGAFVAVGLAIKTFWYKITGIFTGKSAETDTDET